MLVRCSVTVFVPVKKVNCKEKIDLLRESFKIQKGEESYGYEYQNLGHPGTRCSCQGLHIFSRDKFPELERKLQSR